MRTLLFNDRSYVQECARMEPKSTGKESRAVKSRFTLYLRPLVGHKPLPTISRQRIQPSQANAVNVQSPWHPLRQNSIPLCTFGPGGDYVVDWFANRTLQTSAPGPAGTDFLQPAAHVLHGYGHSTTLTETQAKNGLGLRPLQVLSEEIKQLFIGNHPAREFRSDAHPHWTAPCLTCGQHSQYSPWVKMLEPANPSKSAIVHLGITRCPAIKADALPQMQPQLPASEVQTDHLFMEFPNECNAQTTQNFTGHRRLSTEGRLFPNDAGIGGQVGHIKGHRFRARSGTGTKRSAGSGTAQGSLFEPQPSS